MEFPAVLELVLEAVAILVKAAVQVLVHAVLKEIMQTALVQVVLAEPITISILISRAPALMVNANKKF